LGDCPGETLLADDSWGFDEVYWAGAQKSVNERARYRETAAVITLDAFMESHSVPKVDAMKIRAAGAELAVLEGSTKLLTRTDAPLILCELSARKTSQFGYHPVEILWLLMDFGYAVFAMDPKSGQLEPHQANGRYNGYIVAAKPSHIPRLKPASTMS
jgi:hypothetical protein